MRRLVLLSLLLLVAACQHPQPAPLPSVDFSSEQPINIAVGSINVIDEYQPSSRAPNVEGNFQTTPTQAIHTWANQRLRATGGAGRIDIVIHDASVKQTDLPVQKGFQGMFKDQQNVRYDGHITATMRLYDGADIMSKAQADVTVSRSQTLNENATQQDRQRLWYAITNDMAHSFDKEAEMRIRQYFASSIR